jgi:RNA 3'-terminal phosphate cyclase
MQQAAQKTLDQSGIPSTIACSRAEALSPGVGIVLWSDAGTILGADALGEKGVPAEEVGLRAATQLCEDVTAGATLDEHAVDHLLPYLALTGQPVTFTCRTLSRHARTELWLLKQFLGTTSHQRDQDGLEEVRLCPTRTSK